MQDPVSNTTETAGSTPVAWPSPCPPIVQVIHGLKSGRLAPADERHAAGCRTCQASFKAAAGLYGIGQWSRRYLEEGDAFPFRLGMERYLKANPLAHALIGIARGQRLFSEFLEGVRVTWTLGPQLGLAGSFAPGESATPSINIIEWDEARRFQVYASVRDGDLRCYASSDRPELEGQPVRVELNTGTDYREATFVLTRRDESLPFVTGEESLGEFQELISRAPVTNWEFRAFLSSGNPEADESKP